MSQLGVGIEYLLYNRLYLEINNDFCGTRITSIVKMQGPTVIPVPIHAGKRGHPMEGPKAHTKEQRPIHTEKSKKLMPLEHVQSQSRDVRTFGRPSGDDEDRLICSAVVGDGGHGWLAPT
jgi:hypothetical protein